MKFKITPGHVVPVGKFWTFTILIDGVPFQCISKLAMFASASVAKETMRKLVKEWQKVD